MGDLVLERLVPCGGGGRGSPLSFQMSKSSQVPMAGGGEVPEKKEKTIFVREGEFVGAP